MSDIENTGQTQRMYPSPEPAGETKVSESPAFAAACLSNVSGLAAITGWRFGNSVLSHSDLWGFVFRIDFKMKHQDEKSKFINRYICWSGDEDSVIMGTAVVSDQSFKPL